MDLQTYLEKILKNVHFPAKLYLKENRIRDTIKSLMEFPNYEKELYPESSRKITKALYGYLLNMDAAEKMEDKVKKNMKLTERSNMGQKKRL